MSAKDNDDSFRELPPFAHDHDEFRELCARSTAGDLSEPEEAMLRRHLRHCEVCRELIAQYEQVISTVIPAMAAGADPYGEAGPWSIEDAEKRLMGSLDAETSRSPIASSPGRMWRYATAAAILLGVGLAGYVIGRRHPSPSSQPAKQVARSSSSSPQASAGPPMTAVARSAADPVKERVQEHQEQKQVSRLQAELNRANQEIAQQDSALRSSLAEREMLGRQLTDARVGQERLESKAATTGNQVSEDTRELLGLKTRIEDLDRTLEDKDREIAEEQELLSRDRDIRNLIGARDLYIAEIFDVGQSGDTQKPFGRIFYTKDRSLIFYGYDLDQQRGVKKDASFQAWGRREGDRKPDVSLGVFYQDDAGNKRWILKFNDPSLLGQLDAVFITAEPRGGSVKPTGKPLLFTYLRIDPNHP